MKRVLSIAGSDSCGGAGIQADLKTCAALGVDAATVVTAVTAQNTHGVRSIQRMSAAMVRAQMDAVFDGMSIDAVKLGMLASEQIVATVAAQLTRRRPAFVVLDPVLIATSGRRLLETRALRLMRQRLLPLSDCLTPNLAEAAALLGTPCARNEAEMIAQGHALLALGPAAVVMKGGHAALAEAVDLLITADDTHRFAAPWLSVKDLHGTGCILSAGIAANVAKGYLLADAVHRAKTHLRELLGSRRQAEGVSASD
ncbi:bifunctional hydroxymethylpyrimidine kinase/phosphomethylpyrimidine kinase [Rhodanobacter sp. AS-Z3]|uniref:bifunctional hydroxymethylpyrimidine kinase/phosphomethylpyrimidine kinase n=1 Tax=Rhodanobacter sp. AS-Z3 TaxID=3031330 RepID=UPI00247906E4|nr:bifunctional hydroxymethylpyrimidine kinase/phosphomethylpyrimidine kinase [Rhodanobacter sp. AS-Z3]WEN15916.1 bifunctional hydroxymethylpyrimidine kinase/phosphomethylpyrimidine kinase [Rhodanobacter sp. AS-Z3]